MNDQLQPNLVKPIVYPTVTPLILSFFLTVLTLVGCGQSGDSPALQNLNGHYAAPAEIAPYVDEFLTAATAHSKTVAGDLVARLTVRYDDTLPGSVVGRCIEWGTTGIKLIRVKKSLWDTFDEAGHRSILFHELGHCFLGREHDDTAVVDGNGMARPASLMSTEIVRGEIFTAHRDEYLSELFK